MATQPLFDEPFLRAQWDAEFIAFQESDEASALFARLQVWAGREQLTERSSETAFISPVDKCFDYLQSAWQSRNRDATVTEAFDAKRLIKLLLNLRTTEDAPLRTRILTLDQEITALDAEIAQQEAALNAQIYSWIGSVPGPSEVWSTPPDHSPLPTFHVSLPTGKGATPTRSSRGAWS